MHDEDAPGRRDLLRALAALPLLGVGAGCGSEAEQPPTTPAAPNGPTPSPSTSSSTAQPTPSCGAATATQTEGPYFKPSSPERRSLVDGRPGKTMVLSGMVRSTKCEPIAGALVDLWHADADGAYDNVGFDMRGHVFTDADGRYEFETLVPGLYPGRTRHFHVKVQPKGGAILTTQLYFPNEAGNASDGIFSAALIMKIDESGGAMRGTFDFVV